MEHSYYSQIPGNYAYFCGNGSVIKAQLISRFARYSDPDPVDWFSNMPPISLERIAHLTISGFFTALPGTVVLPAATFENLEALDFNKCVVWFVEAISRMLSPQAGEEIPCRSLREMRHDSQGVSTLPTRLAKERKRVGFDCFVRRLDGLR